MYWRGVNAWSDISDVNFEKVCHNYWRQDGGGGLGHTDLRGLASFGGVTGLPAEKKDFSSVVEIVGVVSFGLAPLFRYRAIILLRNLCCQI